MRPCCKLQMQSLVAGLIVCGLSTAAMAQQFDPLFDATGLQSNHSYQDSNFEHIDPFNGSVILTFTDLTLPGNAGMNLTWQRVHNSKLQGGWTFGVPGVPMSIGQADKRDTNPGVEPPLPVYFTADGGQHPAIYTLTSFDKTITKEFWQFDRTTHLLSLPNGWIGEFALLDTTGSTDDNALGVDTRYITKLSDQFGNALVFTYSTAVSPPQLTRIDQQLVACTN